MGKVLSVAGRPSRNASLQQRIEKIASQPKPEMHPLYPTEAKVLNQIRRQHPELNTKISERHLDLEENIKKLRITAQAAFPTLKQESNSTAKEDSNRQLPQNRQFIQEPEYGFHEVYGDKAPPGKLLFHQLTSLLNKAYNERNSDESPVERASKLASDFEVDEESAKVLAKYFAPFTNSVGYEYWNRIDLTSEEAFRKTSYSFRNETVDEIAQLLATHKVISEMGREQMRKEIEAFLEAKKAKQLAIGDDQTKDTKVT